MLDDSGGGLDKDVVPLHAANIAYGCDSDFAWSVTGPGRSVPVEDVQAVVDSLYASGIDSIDLDAMATDLFRDGEDGMRRVRHEPVGQLVFRGPENPHVSAAPDQLCFGRRSGHKSCPEVGTLKECLDYLDLLLSEELPEVESGLKGLQVIGALQGQQVDRAWRRVEGRAFGMD